MEETSHAAKSSGEEELDDLLQSCLNDFNQPLPQRTVSTESQAPAANAPVAAPKASVDKSWSEEFQQFNEVMENFLDDEKGRDELRNLMESLNQRNPPAREDVQSFADTIRDLAEGAQNIPEPTAEDIAELLGNLEMGDSSENVPELLPLMQNMMETLMSKEMLYPSLKDIVDKYPQWLSDHRSSLKEQEYETYSNQFNLMKQVCEEFEKETGNNDEAKKHLFETVLQLMQKIQACGNPPKELVSYVNQAVPFDQLGNLPGMPQQCVIM